MKVVIDREHMKEEVEKLGRINFEIQKLIERREGELSEDYRELFQKFIHQQMLISGHLGSAIPTKDELKRLYLESLAQRLIDEQDFFNWLEDAENDE